MGCSLTCPISIFHSRHHGYAASVTSALKRSTMNCGVLDGTKIVHGMSSFLLAYAAANPALPPDEHMTLFFPAFFSWKKATNRECWIFARSHKPIIWESSNTTIINTALCNERVSFAISYDTL